MKKTPPRLYGWATFTFALMGMLFLISPHQLPLVVYKVSLVTLGVVIAYWLDRALFPNARPHSLKDYYAALAGLRRSVIVLACVIGLTMGL